MITYECKKEFEPQQMEELFLSVGWFSGRFPEKLVIAMRNSSKIISAWDGDVLVGLVRGLDDGGWQATIDCLLVRPDYQGQGIASALLQKLLTEYRDFLYVDVIPEEKKNVSFYEKHGFKVMKEGTPLQIVNQSWKEKRKEEREDENDKRVNDERL